MAVSNTHHDSDPPRWVPKHTLFACVLSSLLAETRAHDYATCQEDTRARVARAPSSSVPRAPACLRPTRRARLLPLVRARPRSAVRRRDDTLRCSVPLREVLSHSSPPPHAPSPQLPSHPRHRRRPARRQRCLQWEARRAHGAEALRPRRAMGHVQRGQRAARRHARHLLLRRRHRNAEAPGRVDAHRRQPLQQPAVPVLCDVAPPHSPPSPLPPPPSQPPPASPPPEAPPPPHIVAVGRHRRTTRRSTSDLRRGADDHRLLQPLSQRARRRVLDSSERRHVPALRAVDPQQLARRAAHDDDAAHSQACTTCAFAGARTSRCAAT